LASFGDFGTTEYETIMMSTDVPPRNNALAARLYAEWKDMFPAGGRTDGPEDGGWSPYLFGGPRPNFSALEPTGKPGYTGKEWFWNMEFKHDLRDANEAVRKAVHDGMIIYGLDPAGATGFHRVVVDKVMERVTKVYETDIFRG